MITPLDIAFRWGYRKTPSVCLPKKRDTCNLRSGLHAYFSEFLQTHEAVTRCHQKSSIIVHEGEPVLI